MSIDHQSEHVLVVPTKAFHDLGYFQGFCDTPEKYVDELFQSEFLSFQPRDEMEHDPHFKQLIPYVLLKYQTQLFVYTRGKGHGEKRLHAKQSLGVGGHISSEDARLSHSPYFAGMQRELAEEVLIDTTYTNRCVGLINDDETEVGKVHLGIVHLVELNAPQVSAREDDIVDPHFAEIQALLQHSESFETWSQICLQGLFGK